MSLEILLSTLLFIVIGLPCLYLSIEYFFGIGTFGKRTIVSGERKECVILIPAHNEESIIGETLGALMSEISEHDRVVVVADNCTDNTAEICRSFAVEVLERTSDTNKGKGFALDFGMQYIADSPPATVVIFDADCQFQAGSFKELVMVSQSEQSAVQSLYLMKAPDDAPLKVRLAEFAWRVKNQVRPGGMRRFGLGCQLQGSGMAFPWELLSKVSLASGSIVEDLELGLKLSEQGDLVRYEPTAIVESYFPCSDEALETQRTRWEHGHLASIFDLVPRFLRAFATGKFKASLMMLDAMIPPTVLWIFISTLCFLSSLMMFLVDFMPAVFVVLSVPYFALVLSLMLVWWFRGRDCISLKDIGGILIFVMGKFSLYKKISATKDKKWIKTERD
ncbi:glycosyltransferase [Corallincola holothuriorum]|uniref:Glycosyltransferase n=1 Tax=Corallincola holothuriorum TaxID=2282215 RepID=A0A368NFQ0_9GAMM|nr:glycosyltransferase family 2 protein [Corallincola holothuriorum]RCU49467.1 glycosyltransferase [Corallincola holothuriorum]